MRHYPLILGLALGGGFALATLTAVPAQAAGQVPKALRTMPSAKLCAHVVPPKKAYAAAVYPMQIAACTKEIAKRRKQGKHVGALYMSRGKIYARQNDCQHAIADFSKAIAQNSGTPYNYLDRGLCYRKLGKTDKALVDFDSAIAAAQGRKAAGVKDYTLRGRAYEQKGALQKAAADYRKAIALAPQSVEARIRLKALKSKSHADAPAGDANKKGDH